jgi:hypothetical protein
LRRQGTDVRDEVRHVQALCLVDCIERAIEVPFSLPDAGRHDMQPIAVLRVAHMLAQVLARLEMPCGGLEVALLTGEVAQSHVHVRRGPQDWLAMLCRQLQCLLVRPDRVTQPSLGDPDVRQGDRTTERIREAARPLHPRHPSAVDSMRGLEVPARPCGQSQERLCCPAEEIVVLGSQIQCLASVPDGRRDVASDLGKHGSVDRDQRSQEAELAPVYDNHLRPPGSGFIWHTVGRREPALAVSQTALDVLELADGQQRPGVGDAQDRSSRDDLIR